MQSILLVSHDRYLIDSLASQIWEVDPHGKSLIVFKGSYAQYKAHKLKMQEVQAAKEALNKDGGEIGETADEKRKPQKTLSKYERRKIKKRLSEVEEEIQQLEPQQEAVGAKLETPPQDPDEVLRLGEEYVEIQNKIEKLMSEWSRLEERLSQ